jgi:ribosomal protein S18 acetylase RimI-like enzyme
VLSGLARDLVAGGLKEIGLEVACTNDAALRLYLSCGFEVMGTEDYYAVSLSSQDS